MTELTKIFTSDQFSDALESWQWLPLQGKVPLCSSLFGSVFLMDRGGLWFLDVVAGDLTRQWDDVEALQSVLATDAGQDEFLLGGLAMAAERAGKVLGPLEIYDFTVPPVLSGPFAVSNIGVVPFSVGMHIAGQIHGQARSMPDGTSVSGVTISEPKAPKRGWWSRR